MSAFESAGQEPGLEIWRIEDFEAVPYDQSQYGKYHVGDSYLVLKVNTYRVFQLDMLHFTRLLGHQKSTFKS